MRKHISVFFPGVVCHIEQNIPEFLTSDAVAAYTQVKIIEDLTYLLGKGPKLVDIWVTIPRNRWPEEWKKDGAHWDDPYVPLRRNLYGHKLAALSWQKFAEWKITKFCGFEKLVDWECLYLHREKKLFLSVYVDDLKMAGKKENLAPMWELLQKHLTLDPPSKMVDNQYLGSTQREIIPDPVNVEKMGAAFESFSVKHGDQAARVAHPELRKDGQPEGSIDQAGSPHVDLDQFAEGVDGNTSCGNAKPRYDPAKRKKGEDKSAPKSTQVRGYAYDMSGHVSASVDRYLELSSKPRSSLKRVATPCIDDH